MKELSIEDKAKAYDEAIERAKEMIKAMTNIGGVAKVDDIQYLFPELKESEDEKIRNWLIETIKQVPNDSIEWETIEKSSVLAWLEKQGEQQLNGTFINADDVREEFMQEVYRILDADATNDRANQIIDAFDNLPSVVYSNQGEHKPNPCDGCINRKGCINCENGELRETEQKPAFEMKTPEESLGIDSDTYNKIVDECIYGEQKPAWSEEDEVKINRIVACLENLNVADNDILLKDVDWLKSLKDRVHPQPKQEWSEEDEEALEEVRINFEINKGKMTPALQECYDKFFDKIKTLNPYLKKEWSEEDKEFINDLIGIFDGQQYQAHSDEEIVKWLKTIRLPYNKEWDEKDEEMLRSIIATCELAEQDRDSSPAKHLLEMQLDWLKSLRPQNRWKPSDEQMDELRRYSDNVVLRNLYYNLKKLKKE